MTLPTDIILPEPEDFSSDPSEYIANLIDKLQDMYEDVASNVNGTFRNESDVDGSEWIPTLTGSATAGSFTYTSQIGWVFRQGIMVDVWGQISWSATTATGNLVVNLPYQSTKSSAPFIGTCSTSGITYGSGTYPNLSAISGSYTANIVTSGSAATSSTLPVVASGSINFYIRYIGVSDE